MSEKTTTSKYSIVRAIAALLNLGDQGKLDSFVARVVKTLKKDITALKKNLDIAEFNYKQELETLEDKQEDAQEALNAAYLHIDVNKITTNEAQVDYVDQYLDNIKNKKSTLNKIESQIEKLKESYTDKAKDIQKQIDSLEATASEIDKK